MIHDANKSPSKRADAKSVDQTPPQRVPGPRGLPFAGVGLQLQKHGCAYLSELTSRYGRIVNFPLPGIRGVLVADKDLVKQVLLKTERGFYKGKIYDLLTPVVGRGLVTNQGASWRKRRLLLKPMFQPSALSELDPILDSCCQKLFAQIEQSIDQRRPLDTTASMMELTFSVLIRSFFSGDLTSHYQELAGAFAQLQAWIGHRFWAPIRLPPNWPTPRNRQFHKAMDYLRAAVLDLIRQRRSRPSRQGGDLLDRILVARDAETGSPLTEQELIDEIITMLIAGPRHHGLNPQLYVRTSGGAPHPSCKIGV